MKITSLIGITSLVMITAACQPKSPALHNKTHESAAKTQVANGNFNIEFSPKVDILFVVDNSMSMDNDQKNLSKNIDRFVKAFAQNDLIDFHIGVTSVWDSIRFNHNPKCLSRERRRQVIDNYKNGELWHLTDDKGNLITEGKRYIDRETPNLLPVLANSIKIGAHRTKDPYCGPEHEELFSPVLESFDSAQNQDFYRDDAELVVIFVTDAEDGSDISARELAESVYEFKGGKAANKLSTYGVIYPIGETCPGKTKDEGPKVNGKDSFPDPIKIAEFIEATDGRRLSLCSDNFGDDLAEIGADIKRKVARKMIHLDEVPEAGTVRIFYGKSLSSCELIDPKSNSCETKDPAACQCIPWDADSGWSYHRDQLATLIISENFVDQLKYIENASIFIEYTPVNMNDTKNKSTVPQ